ncbi:hypothetical protein HPG69_003453 [Diceros bicornis minor]|uniref:RETREG1-3/ARL6IP-like N-terminal reticulon-homology domain-containing protein n=1 Tax=Diceros bicornis minor TaxID=77932 RepID=A0A7J7E908_DICBM|nr:hypothetical protein HPG69_003453 [Diceros bicornis minor]
MDGFALDLGLHRTEALSPDHEDSSYSRLPPTHSLCLLALSPSTPSCLPLIALDTIRGHFIQTLWAKEMKQAAGKFSLTELQSIFKEHESVTFLSLAEPPNGEYCVLHAATQVWEVINSKPDERPRLSHCFAESWMNFSIFLQEIVCTFFTVLGSYIPGVILSYLLLLCAFLCPLFKCNDIGQKIYSKIKSVLLKLDFGIGEYISQKKRERSEADKEKSHKDDSELDFSALCPKISLTVAAKELSVSDTDVSEVSWTDNGTFNLSEGYTPQTDTSDDLDRPSEEVFSRDLSDFPSLENGTGTNDEDELSLGLPAELKRKKEQLDSSLRPSKERQAAAGLALPLSSDQTFHLMSNLAGDVITAAVTAAIKDQIGGLQQALAQAAPSPGEDTDTEEGDDFELLDQSELDQIESELGLSRDQEAEAQQNKKSAGFLSNLLGGH